MAPKAPAKPAAKPAAAAAKPAAKAPAKPAAKPAKVAAKVAAKPAGKAAKPAGKAAAKGAKGQRKSVKKDTKKVTKEVYFKNLFQSRKRNFGIGQDIPPKREVTRFVRWPKYVTLQRQKRVLERRLKVPPTLNQFRKTLDSHTKNELFKFAAKYAPEKRKQKVKRLRAEAKAANAQSANKHKVVAPKKSAKSDDKRPQLKFGIQRVTRLIEHKRAKLVLIAHDVDPIEIVLFLPALCKKLDIPYCIVKGKAALGRLVGYKTCSVCCFNKIRSEDNSKFNKLVETVTASFNDKYDDNRKTWGGLELGRRAKVQKKAAE
jgi:large subunit ribosomal protein L7Ae